MKALFRFAVLAAFLIGFAQPSQASTFTFSDGTRAASATFTISSGTLTIKLENTASYNPATDQLDPTHILTGVLWDITTAATLSPLTATAEDVIQDGSGSQPCAGTPATCNNDVRGESVYNLKGDMPTDSSTPGGTWDQGVGTSGQLGGNFNFPGGTNQAGPDAVDGPQFGIAPAGFTAGDGNGGATTPLIQNFVTWTFAITGQLTEADIADVIFVYGTNWNETPPGQTGDVTTETTVTTSRGPVDTNGDVGVPEPASLLLLGSGLVGAATRFRRRRS